MNRRTSLPLLAGLAALVWAVTPGQAQVVERGNFDVVIGGGGIMHPNHSALVSYSPVLNLQTQLYVTENVGVGVSLDYMRTETDDDIFPYAQFDFGAADSTILVALKQPVSIFNYMAFGSFGFDMGERLFPYLMGGIGGYTIYLDPQQNAGPVRESDIAFAIGGAVKFAIAGSSSIEVGLRDIVWTGFNRDLLDPTPDRTCRESGVRQFRGQVCPNERFPFLDPELSDSNWSEAKETVHNIVLTVGFSFVPRL
jgi:opacity protein-like surface antigen